MSFRKITPSTYHLEQDMLLSEKDEKGENTRKSGTSDKVGVRADDEGTDDVFDEKASPREKGDNFTKKKRRRRKSSSSKDNNPVEESSTKPDPMKAADSQKSPKKPDQIATSVCILLYFLVTFCRHQVFIDLID